jgi:predicted Zn-dependent protease
MALARPFRVARASKECAKSDAGVQNVTRNLAQRLVLTLFVLLLVLSPIGHLAASTAPSNYHWARQSKQFTVRAGDNYSGVWDKLVPWAIKGWNKSDTVTIKTVKGGTNAQNCNPTKGKIEVCSFMYGTQVGWLGLTRLYFDSKGQHIESTTVQMNDSFFNQKGGKYNSDAARRHTICHEMGHAIGLDHVNTKSCMNDSQSAVFNNLVPINKDFRELTRIYKHTDSYTTLAGKQKKDKKKQQDKTAKNGKKSKKDAKKQRRKEARKKLRERKRAGKASIGAESTLGANETMTMERLDDGQLVVTFVTWVDE